MIRLFNLEWHKIKSYAVFWVIFGIALLLFLLTAVISAAPDFKVNIFMGAGFEIRNLFRFPYVWTSLAWMAGLFSHIFALLIIILIGNEFNYRMMRQQLVFGVERKNLFLSKVLLILAIPVITTILVVVLSLIFGFSFSENPGLNDIFSYSFFALNFYVQSVALMGFAFMVILLLRSTGLSIILYLVYIFFEVLVRLFFRYYLKLVDVVFFFPMKSISSLTPKPSVQAAMNDQLRQQMNFVEEVLHFNEFVTLLIPILYAVIFFFLSYLMIKKRDL